MWVLPSAHLPQRALARMSQSRLLRKYLGRPYLRSEHLDLEPFARLLSATWRFVRAYGVHLHGLIQLQAARTQSVGTFFFRNRPELELLTRLINQKPRGSTVGLTILGCSKGAEVYSMSYAIRGARPDLKVSICAIDISKDILEFAEAGVYSLKSRNGSESSGADPLTDRWESRHEHLQRSTFINFRTHVVRGDGGDVRPGGGPCEGQATVPGGDQVAPWGRTEIPA